MFYGSADLAPKLFRTLEGLRVPVVLWRYLDPERKEIRLFGFDVRFIVLLDQALGFKKILCCVFPQAQSVAGHMYQNDPTWGAWS